jgi:flavin-dependent dehydrogenase
MTERIVVIGADAAGMSAASQAKRIAGDAVEIVAFERGTYSSYAACGIPYWAAGDVDEPERLIAPFAGCAPAQRHRPSLTTRSGRKRTITAERSRARGSVYATSHSSGQCYDSYQRLFRHGRLG